MKTLQEFCEFMDEFVSKAPKLNLDPETNRTSHQWIGPPSGLEKSIGRKNLPPIIHGKESNTNYSTNTSGKDPLIYLNPTQLKTTFKRHNATTSSGMETVVAHELGHHQDNLKGKHVSSFEKEKILDVAGQHEKAARVYFKRELRANKEGEALLAKHGRPPMHKEFKKGSIASHHSFVLASLVDKNHLSAHKSKSAMDKYTKYHDRAKKQGIKFQLKGEEY